MADRVVDIGKEKFDSIAKEIARFQKFTIRVGYQDSAGTDLAVIDIATFMEFGTINIEARPFLSSAMDTNMAAIGEAFEREIGTILDGKQTAIQAGERLGIFAVTLVKKRITSSPEWAEPLAEATIDAKGSDVPLIDTAELLNSVTYTVSEGDTVVASG